MTVQWLGLKIVSSNGSKLQTIKSWIASHISDSDFNEHLGSKEANLFYDEDNEVYVLSMSAFIYGTVDKAKYKDMLKNQLQSLNKSDLDLISIKFYDDCSHDSDHPQPCSPTEIYRYEA